MENQSIDKLLSVLQVDTVAEAIVYYPKIEYQIPDSFPRAKRNFELLYTDFSKGKIKKELEEECIEILGMYVLKMIEFSKTPGFTNKKEAAEMALKSAKKIDKYVGLATKNYCDIYRISLHDLRIQAELQPK